MATHNDPLVVAVLRPHAHDILNPNRDMEHKSLLRPHTVSYAQGDCGIKESFDIAPFAGPH